MQADGCSFSCHFKLDTAPMCIVVRILASSKHTTSTLVARSMHTEGVKGSRKRYKEGVSVEHVSFYNLIFSSHYATSRGRVIPQALTSN